MILKNKKILITAGPTWVALDKVRVLSNMSTGENGIRMAEQLCREGAKVTLILGPIKFELKNPRIRLLRFTFFDQLKDIVIKELKTGHYDWLIHSAAISDYQPDKFIPRKVSSNQKSWKVTLVPTPKIIDLARKADKNTFLVGFKFEPDITKKALLKDAHDFMLRSGSNLVVANSYKGNVYEGKGYQAFITDGSEVAGPFKSKKLLAKELIILMKKFYGKK
jgi:phosphopantothenoylcysteine synthetase/decarboxylase